MIVNRLALDNQREQIQEDLECVLDGLDNQMMINVCQIIVDRFEILENQL